MEALAFLLSFDLDPTYSSPNYHHIPYLPPEMEFLEISLTKVSSLLLYAIHTSQSLQMATFKENCSCHTLFWFLKYIQKNPRNKKN
jgi:hypothetical protein